MNKNMLKIGLVISAVISITACGGSSCSTKEDVAEKAKELTEKFEDVVKSGDMSKIMALGGKVQNIQSIGSSKDPQAACDAIDALMDEL